MARYIMTEEHKNKIRIARANQKPPRLGMKTSEETKKKMSDARKGIPSVRKGIPLTEEHKQNISKGNSGKKRTLEMIKKMTERVTGFHHTKETRLKMSESRKLDKHYNWKGGISSENSRARSSGEYVYWRKECFKRDNFTCQKTGQSGGKLVVHHINNFADFPELRYDINNGITLSLDAHKEFHKIYGVRNNTKEQILEYIENK